MCRCGFWNTKNNTQGKLNPSMMSSFHGRTGDQECPCGLWIVVVGAKYVRSAITFHECTPKLPQLSWKRESKITFPSHHCHKETNVQQTSWWREIQADETPCQGLIFQTTATIPPLHRGWTDRERMWFPPLKCCHCASTKLQCYQCIAAHLFLMSCDCFGFISKSGNSIGGRNQLRWSVIEDCFCYLKAWWKTQWL